MQYVHKLKNNGSVKINSREERRLCLGNISGRMVLLDPMQ